MKNVFFFPFCLVNLGHCDWYLLTAFPLRCDFQQEEMFARIHIAISQMKSDKMSDVFIQKVVREIVNVIELNYQDI